MISVITARVIYGLFGSTAPPAAQAIVAIRTSREGEGQGAHHAGLSLWTGYNSWAGNCALSRFAGRGLAGPAMVFAVFGLVTAIAATRWLPPDSDEPDWSDARGANVSYPLAGRRANRGTA